MPLFKYEAVDASGEVVKGEMEVATEALLIDRLRDQGLMPLSTDNAETSGLRGLLSMEIGGKNRIKDKDIELMTGQLSRLLRAGLPLDRALTILISVTEDQQAINRLLTRVQEHLRGGGNLGDALEAQHNVFSKLYINMVRAGEMGGSLDVVLERLTEFLARARALKDTVISAMIYPIILFVVAIASVMGLLAFVVPKFEKIFIERGQILPVSTQVVVNIGHVLQNYWWFLLGFAVMLAVFISVQLKRPSVRYRFDGWKLRMPIFGDLTRKTEISRFARSLATLLANGVAVLPALSVIKETITNVRIAEAVQGALDHLKSGKGLSAPLAEAKIFPPMAIHMMRVGEETGQLESMLYQIANTYDEEVQIAVKRMLSMLEPLVIVLMAMMIGGIMMSIMLPIIQTTTLS